MHKRVHFDLTMLFFNPYKAEIMEIKDLFPFKSIVNVLISSFRPNLNTDKSLFSNRNCFYKRNLYINMSFTSGSNSFRVELCLFQIRYATAKY